MFTIRFIQNAPQKQIVVECARYDVENKEGGYQITAYPTMTSENGVEWWLIHGNGRQMNSCYISNSHGKTIDSYHLGESVEEKGIGTLDGTSNTL